MDSIKNIRTDYTKGEMTLESTDANPVDQLKKWMNEAKDAGALESNAFCLTTLNLDGCPTGRIVLARGMDERGLEFYTNRNSNKGEEMKANDRVGATFFWPEVERQVRVVGKVVLVSDEESDNYFNSRPRDSRVGAWASSQSQPMNRREELNSALKEAVKRFEGMDLVPRPPHWGGYRIEIQEYEFWQGRASRLHDRIKYTKGTSGSWERVLLQP